MMKDTITFRYRMSDRDVFYGGGVVNGARSITLMEDAAKRLMAKTFGNTGRCVEVKKSSSLHTMFCRRLYGIYRWNQKTGRK